MESDLSEIWTWFFNFIFRIHNQCTVHTNFEVETAPHIYETYSKTIKTEVLFLILKVKI